MSRKSRYAHLQGSSALYPFGARARLRRRQRRHVVLLRVAGLALFVPVAALALRQTVFRGGQPQRPDDLSVQPATSAESRETASGGAVRVSIHPATAGSEPAGAGQTAEASVRAVLPEYQQLYSQNPDMVGWLSVPAAGIDYQVMQTPGDNEYYLRRGFDRLYSLSGSLFLDEQCSLYDPATDNWIIYGHNMFDGTMFGALGQFTDVNFYQQHPTFSFDTLYEEMEFQIVMVLHTTVGEDVLPYYTFFDVDSAEEWQQRYDAMLERRLFDSGVDAEYGDQLLTLSTCGADPDDRIAVVAKRIS